jgi:Tfp pilus assembly protein PilF
LKLIFALLSATLLFGCASKSATPPSAYDFVLADAERRSQERSPPPQPSSETARAQARVDVAIAQFEIGNFSRALSVSEESLALDPKNPNARLLLALSQERLRADSTLIRRSYEMLLLQHPNFYDGLHNFGIFLCSHAANAEGYAFLRQAILLKPRAERSLLAASQCAPSSAERISLSKQALELQPTWTLAWLSLSESYAAQSDWLRAHQSLLRYFYLEGEPSESSYRLALLVATAQQDDFHQRVYSQKLKDLSTVSTHVKD